MKIVLNYLGFILIVFSFFLLIPASVALALGEPVIMFIVAFFITLGAGILLKNIAREMGEISGKVFSLDSISLVDGFTLVGISFVILSAISMLPYLTVMKGDIARVIVDSYFEGISGITTTGLSVITDISSVPESVLIWRSLTQWIGGIGIVVVFLFIIYKLRSREGSVEDHASSIRLFRSMIAPRAEPNVTKLLKQVFIIYLSFTVVGIIAFLAAGLDLLDSMALTFSSLSTGGFLPVDIFYNSVPIQVITIALMLIGAISFIAYDRLFTGKIKEFFLDLEFRYLIGTLALMVLLGIFVADSFMVLLFEMTSALTGSGFSIATVPLLHPLLVFLIFIGMLIGGSTCSSTGGIKQFRYIILLKSVFWHVKKMSSPVSAVIPFKLSRKDTIESGSVLLVHILVFSFFLFIILGTLVFLYLGYPILDSIFQVTSALCTVGLTTLEISSIPIAGKIVLMLEMLLGRLEIFPILILIKNLFKA